MPGGPACSAAETGKILHDNKMPLSAASVAFDRFAFSQDSSSRYILTWRATGDHALDRGVLLSWSRQCHDHASVYFEGNQTILGRNVVSDILTRVQT